MFQAFTKVNVPLFGVQYLAVIVGLVSYLIPAEKNLGIHNATVPACQIANYSNLGPDRCEFFLANYSYDTVSSRLCSSGLFFPAIWPFVVLHLVSHALSPFDSTHFFVFLLLCPSRVRVLDLLACVWICKPV